MEKNLKSTRKRKPRECKNRTVSDIPGIVEKNKKKLYVNMILNQHFLTE